MAIILNIDTAVSSASICLSENNNIIDRARHDVMKDHASWLHTAIKKMMADAGRQLDELDAIAVTIGPGSYTGLRVGLAAAKGLCFALGKPLVALNTLQVIAAAEIVSEHELIAAAIDARRMEIFTAVYNNKLAEVMKPQPLVIDHQSFQDLLAAHRIIFTGNGVAKLKEVIDHPNAIFRETIATAEHMTGLSLEHFLNKKFADLAYIEPLYLKEFYTGNSK